MNHALKYSWLFVSLIVMSCNSTTHSNSDESIDARDTNTTASVTQNMTETNTSTLGNKLDAPPEYGEDFTETYFIVIADTSNDYFKLRRKMVELHKFTALPIDTMDRYFNTNHNRIMLPDSLEDELYGTYYFMRRYPSTSLSIEYLDHYDTTATENCMALFSGIFESKSAADSLLNVLRPKYPKSYKLKVDMYVGCMH